MPSRKNSLLFDSPQNLNPEEKILHLASLFKTKPLHQDDSSNIPFSFDLMNEFYNRKVFQDNGFSNSNFSLLNGSCSSLINKRLLKKRIGKEKQINGQEKNGVNSGLDGHVFGFDLPTSTKDQNFIRKNDFQFKQGKTDFESNMIYNEKTKTEKIVQNSPQKKKQKKKKKLPYLDKKFRKGYLKFFDTKNNFGFMKPLEEPKDDIFVNGIEFVKRDFSKELIKSANGNPNVVFRFRTIHYEGKHGESKKAVEIKLHSSC